MLENVNPFHFGGVVEGEAFCNRKRALYDLERAAINADRLFVCAGKRAGKTSLAKRMLARLSRKRFVPIYIDLWLTDSTDAFINTMAREVVLAIATRKETFADTVRSLFHHVTPAISFDESGEPVLQLGTRGGSVSVPALEDVLDAHARVAAKDPRRFVVVFDHVHRLLEYETDVVEWTIGRRIRAHKNVAYLFLGSRTHLVQKMFLDSDRPLYRTARHYPLGNIETRSWQPFIRERFTSTGKKIDSDRVRELCSLTDGHPFYTQHLAHTSWEVTPPGENVTSERLDHALDIVLRRVEMAYAVLWDTLSRNQRRLLKGIATEGKGARPFSGVFVQQYGIGSPSSAQQSAGALLDKDILARDETGWFVGDRFFRLWIERRVVGSVQ